jgi:AcrR family transcriptional regulator
VTDVNRQYRQSTRAEKTASTRQRIVEAAIELHGTVGPANTSLSAVAREAGVSRPTLYSHFDDEASLFRACTMHWMSQDPPPDPAAWLEIDDPIERTGTALREIYSHYTRNEQMTSNVFRDMYLVESMRSFNVPIVEASFEAMTEIIGSAFDDGPDLTVRRRAIVSVAIAFNTWRSLVKTEGLTNDEAGDLMAHVIACVRKE